MVQLDFTGIPSYVHTDGHQSIYTQVSSGNDVLLAKLVQMEGALAEKTVPWQRKTVSWQKKNAPRTNESRKSSKDRALADKDHALAEFGTKLSKSEEYCCTYANVAKIISGEQSLLRELSGDLTPAEVYGVSTSGGVHSFLPHRVQKWGDFDVVNNLLIGSRALDKDVGVRILPETIPYQENGVKDVVSNQIKE